MEYFYEVIKVGKVTNEKGKGRSQGYQSVEITFKDVQDGKVGGQKLVSFAYPEVFELASNLEEDTFIKVTKEKIKGFWTWTNLEIVDSEDVPKEEKKPVEKQKLDLPRVKATEKSQWVPDDVRQRLIVRQSSISNAIAMLGPKASFEAVRDLAIKFEKHVFGEEETKVTDSVVEVD